MRDDVLNARSCRIPSLIGKIPVAGIRQRYTSMLTACQNDPLKLMDWDNQAAVAHFIHSILRLHASPLSHTVPDSDVSYQNESGCDESELEEVFSEEEVELVEVGGEESVLEEVLSEEESELVEVSSDGVLLSSLLVDSD